MLKINLIFYLISSLGQPIFWPKDFKFWLYNLQILTSFWPINFLRLQLQNSSALGVKVNPETYSCTLSIRNYKKFGSLTSGMIYW